MAIPPPNLLTSIASLSGLLGIALFYTGWIYRWSYFAFYQLEVTTLNLPLESFLLAPLQVFFGTPSILFQTILAGLLLVVLILATQRLIAYGLWRGDRHKIQRYNRLQQNTLRLQQNTLRILPLPSFNPDRPSRLVQDSIIVFWVLLILFHLAKHQGLTDARRDACNPTSTRPAVAFISSPEQLALGKALGNLDPTKPLSDVPEGDRSLIGDPDLARAIQNSALNEESENQVWRLLIKRDGWLYLFRTLACNADQNQEVPLVLAIPPSESAEQLLILSPEPAK